MSVDPDDYPMTTIDDVSGMIVIFCHKASAIFSVAEDLEPVIPPESSILASKRERNRATLSTGRDDYISLTVAKQDDEYRGPHPESRLVREEDELGEGEDGQWIFSRLSVILVDVAVEFAEFTSAQERIALGKKSQKMEAQQREAAMKDMIADA